MEGFGRTLRMRGLPGRLGDFLYENFFLLTTSVLLFISSYLLDMVGRERGVSYSGYQNHTMLGY